MAETLSIDNVSFQGHTGWVPRDSLLTVDVVEPQQDRSIESAQQIIGCATELFIEHGYKATTFAMISKRTGYSRGIVTSRFGNKKNLAYEIVRQATAQWDEVLGLQGLASSGLEDIVEFVRVSEYSMLNSPTSRLVMERLYSESASEMAPLHARFKKSIKDLEQLIAGFIEKGKDDGSIRADVEAAPTAKVLISQLRGIGYQWFLFPDLVDPVVFHDLLIKQLMAWLQNSNNR